MVAITLYHNPRCSKSREALALLEEAGAEVQVRRYLDEPLAAAELEALLQRLEGEVSSLVRQNEAEWKERGADADDPRQVIEAVLAHPRILQRPIADDGRRAIVGRPPEAIRALLG
ncbi:arsenate reductase (glutaredoxin) [Halomonas denitrificans]|uniref:arsenate reductase (glutaredoxin) n=1 Tax=Halomonas denitrificans TaxID=370769 RepID=UPI000D38BC41|nr:arsenate reductase (glutaredoxin) [Halomonas denitrificans]